MQKQLSAKKLLEDLNYYDGMIEEFNKENRTIKSEYEEAKTKMDKYRSFSSQIKKPAKISAFVISLSMIAGGIFGYMGNLSLLYTSLATLACGSIVGLTYIATNAKTRELFRTCKDISNRKESNERSIEEFNQKRANVLEDIRKYNRQNIKKEDKEIIKQNTIENINDDGLEL